MCKSLRGHLICNVLRRVALKAWRALCFWCAWVPAVHAWNATGHQVITEIALHHMTPHALKRFKAYEPSPDGLLWASTWLDKVRGRWPASRPMHYIDMPYLMPNTSNASPKLSGMNAVLAVYQAKKMLLNDKLSMPERVVALRVLLHVVGDLHQPLHAINRFSSRYPKGDRGGNLVRLAKNKVAKNLHAYWDRGAGLLLKPVQGETLMVLVKRIEATTPPCVLSEQSQDPMRWAEGSYKMARTEVYPAWQHTRAVSQRQRRADYPRVNAQLALAGCRLAAVLNEIDRELRHARLK